MLLELEKSLMRYRFKEKQDEIHRDKTKKNR